MRTRISRLAWFILVSAIATLQLSMFDLEISAQSRRHTKADQTRRKRERPPQPGPLRPFRLPTGHQITMPNGLTLVLVEDHRAPLVTIAAGVPVGSADDHPGEGGIAEATAELLTEGSSLRGGNEIASEVEGLGGQIQSWANQDYTEVSASVIAENAYRMVDILGEVLLKPSFPEDEVTLYKSNRIDRLKVERQDPAQLAREQFRRAVYGAHPYAITAPTEESIAAITREKIQRFYRARYQPKGTVLIIVGDFDRRMMEDKVKVVFSDWPAGSPIERRFPSPPKAARTVILVDRPGSQQAEIWIGGLAVDHSDSDYYPLLVGLVTLGGGTSSRLFLNLREQKGYAYDVSASLYGPRERGAFQGTTQTRTGVALLAINEMLGEFKKLASRELSALELQNVKNYLTGGFSLALSTQGGTAEQLLVSNMLGLGSDYVEKYRGRIQEVTADQVRRAADKYLDTDRVAIVVVGDGARLRNTLRRLGPVKLVDIEGRVRH